MLLSSAPPIGINSRTRRSGPNRRHVGASDELPPNQSGAKNSRQPACKPRGGQIPDQKARLVIRYQLDTEGPLHQNQGHHGRKSQRTAHPTSAPSPPPRHKPLVHPDAAHKDRYARQPSRMQRHRKTPYPKNPRRCNSRYPPAHSSWPDSHLPQRCRDPQPPPPVLPAASRRARLHNRGPRLYQESTAAIEMRPVPARLRLCPRAYRRLDRLGSSLVALLYL